MVFPNQTPFTLEARFLWEVLKWGVMLKGTRLYQLLVSIVFLAVLGYLLSSLKLGLVYKELVALDPMYLFLGALILAVAALLKIYRFQIVVRIYGFEIPFLEAALVQMVGISFATLTPGRVGEGSKAVLLNKRADVPISSALGMIIFERFFDMILLATGAFLFSQSVLQREFALAIGLFLAALVVFFILFLRHFNSIKRFVPKRYIEYFTPVSAGGGMHLSLLALIFTAATWLTEALFPWLLARSMGANVSFTLVFGVLCISTIAVVLSVLPAGLGTMDLSFLVLLPKIGVTAETALSILLIYRFFGIITPFIFSLVLLNLKKTSFKEIRSDMGG